MTKDHQDILDRVARAISFSVGTITDEQAIAAAEDVLQTPLPSTNATIADAVRVGAVGAGWKCAARQQPNGPDTSADCDWPVCGCDPAANKVIEALEEAGHLHAAPTPPAPVEGDGDLGSRAVPLSSHRWLPIETAPKDGTPFLAYIPQASWHVGLKPTVATLYWAPWENFASLLAERIGETEGDMGDWGPTHWMPLPAPPGTDEGLQDARGTAREPKSSDDRELIGELCEALEGLLADDAASGGDTLTSKQEAKIRALVAKAHRGGTK